MRHILLTSFLLLSGLLNAQNWDWAKGSIIQTANFKTQTASKTSKGVWVAGEYGQDGGFANSFTFDNITFPAPTSPGVAAFIMHIDESGNVLSHNYFQGQNRQIRIQDIETDSIGNVYVCGAIDGAFQFGNISIVNPNENRGFICKLDTNCNFLWANSISMGSNLDTEARDIIIKNNRLTVLSQYKYSQSLNNYRVSLKQFDFDGNIINSQTVNGFNLQVYDSDMMVMDKFNNLYILGSFLQDLTYQSNSLNSTGGTDVFLLKTDFNLNYISLKKWGSSLYESSFTMTCNDDNIFISGSGDNSAFNFGNFQYTAGLHSFVGCLTLNLSEKWILNSIPNFYSYNIIYSPYRHSLLSMSRNLNTGNINLCNSNIPAPIASDDIILIEIDTLGNCTYFDKAVDNGQSFGSGQDISENGLYIYLTGSIATIGNSTNKYVQFGNDILTFNSYSKLGYLAKYIPSCPNNISAEAGSYPSICANADIIQLANGQPTGGNYSGTGVVNNTFNPSLANNGSNTITYTITDAFGCTGTDNTTITVNPLPDVNYSTTDSLCQGSAPLQLSGGSPIGGTYIGNGVSNGTLDPSALNIGETEVLYTYQDGNGCSAADTSTFVILADVAIGAISGQVNVNTGTTQTYSVSGNPNYNYLWTVTGGSITAGQGTSSITVLWSNNEGNGSISVLVDNTICSDTTSMNISITKTSLPENHAAIFNLYPNPISDILNISLKNTAKKAQVEVYNTNGKLVYSYGSISTNNIQIPTVGFAAGFYSVKINVDGAIAHKTFIKD